MPITPKEVLTDPKFAKLTPDQKRQVLLRIDPNFSDLSADQQQVVLNFKPPNVATLPPGEISAGPRGMDAVRAKLYSTIDPVARARNMITNNLDTAGGIAGGLAGSTAGPIGSVTGATLGGAAGRSLTQLINTMRGRPQASSMDAATDIAAGGLEQGAMETGGVGLSKISKMLKPASRESLLSYGAKAGEMGPEIKALLPDLDRAAAGGRPKSVADFSKLVDTVERNLNQEFNTALFPIAQQPVAAHPVANAILQEITPNMAKTSEGRAMRAYLTKRATEFNQGTWTIAELNKERELVSKRLRAYHNAIGSGQTASSRVHANVAADTATEGALKDLLYTAADQSGVKPPGYFTALKQKQSQLISLGDIVKGSKEKLTKASMEREGAPMSEKIHFRNYLHSSSMPGSVVGISPASFSDPLLRSDKAISKAFPTTAGKVGKAVRQGAAKAISNPDLNALPVRAAFTDYSEDQP